MSTKSPLKLRLQQFVQLVVGLGAAGASHATATVPPTTALDADADLDRYTHAVAERRFPAAGPRAPQPFEPPIAFVPLVALFEQRRLGLRGPAGARVFPATGASQGTRTRDALRILVMRVQAALLLKNYDPGEVDGTMSTATIAALKKYQADRGLKVTGTINAQTLDALALRASF
jgi:hypothetical protein